MLKAFVPAGTTRPLHPYPPALSAFTLPSQHPLVFFRQSLRPSRNGRKLFHSSSPKTNQQLRHEEAANDDARGRKKTARSTAAKNSLRRVAIEAERSSRTGICQELGGEGKNDTGTKIKVRSDQDACSASRSQLMEKKGERGGDSSFSCNRSTLSSCFVAGCHSVLRHRAIRHAQRSRLPPAGRICA